MTRLPVHAPFRPFSVFSCAGAILLFAALVASCASPSAPKAPAVPSAAKPLEAVQGPTAETKVNYANASVLDPTKGFALGIEREVEADFPNLRFQRVTLVTNHTALTTQGRHTLEILYESPKFSLTDVILLDDGDTTLTAPMRAIFEGAKPPRSHPVGPALDACAAPMDAIRHADVVVFDAALPGPRASIEAAALGTILEAASLHRKRFVVLDRPTLLPAEVLEGPLPDEELVGSCTTFLPVLANPNMTAGELATLYNTVYGIGADLRVVRLEQWRRSDGNRWITAPGPRELPAAGLAAREELLRTGAFSPAYVTFQQAGRLAAPAFKERKVRLVAPKEPAAPAAGANLPVPFVDGGAEFVFRPAAVDAPTVMERLSQDEPDGIRFAWGTVENDRPTSDVITILPEPAGSVPRPVELSIALRRAAGGEWDDAAKDLLDGTYGAGIVSQGLGRGLTAKQIRARWSARPEHLEAVEARSKALLYEP